MSYDEDTDVQILPVSVETESKKIENEFINVYQRLPLLWDMQNVDYSNKYKRNVAYDKLLVILKKLNHAATRYNVRQKINILRSCYRKDLRKHLASKGIGSNGEITHEYIPNSWKFHKLRFLDCNEKSDTKKGDIAKVPVAGESYDEQASNQCSEDSTSGQQCHDDETREEILIDQDSLPMYCERKPYVNRRRQRKKVKVEVDRNEYYVNTENEELLDREFESIGANVACKLKRMNMQQRYHAELLINKVLIRGLKNCLTDDTVLTDVWNV